MLLVVTNKTDLASDYLILRLKERQIPFQRLNTEDFGEGFRVDIHFHPEPDFLIKLDNGKIIGKEDISGVYFRQPRTPNISLDIAESDCLFVRRELQETLRSLWRMINEEKWLNHPRNLWLANNKIEQLSVANDIGLNIPETCVTTSQRRLQAFYKQHNKQIICKAVKNGFSHDNNLVTLAMTKRVEHEFIENFDTYAAVPALYQREIIKEFDVRVTVVGDSIFATAIYSQEHQETEVDWRLFSNGNFDLRHEAIDLPKNVANACREITKHYGLRYSAIDLVLGIDDQYYFLELNPNGQWVWIEQKTGYPIRDAIIDTMALRSQVHA